MLARSLTEKGNDGQRGFAKSLRNITLEIRLKLEFRGIFGIVDINRMKKVIFIESFEED